jgi:hypothetical protein
MDASEMPRWKCHKIVRASSIVSLASPTIETVAGFVTVEANVFARIVAAVNAKGQTDLGYLVLYDDDYVSWSPTKAFEAGYARI